MRSNFQLLSLLLLLFTGATFSYSQEYSVSWGELERSTSRANYILPDKGSDFYTLRAKGRRLLGASLYMSKHEGFSEVLTEKIELKVNNSFAQFEGVLTINNNIYVFLSDRDQERNYIFMQRYTSDLRPNGPAELLASYNLDKRRDRGSFDVLKSRDGSHFGVVWSIPGKKTERDRYGFKIFNKQQEEISTGDYKLPYDGDLSRISQQYLSNSGDYFIAVTEYDPSEKKILRSYLNYKAMHVLHIMPGDFDQITIDIKGKRLEQIFMNSDNEELFTFTGIYGEEDASNSSGIFYIRLDYKNNEILDKNFEKFSEKFITQDWSQRSIDKAESRKRRGRGEPQLYNYVMRQSEVLNDGSLVGSIEQKYVVENIQTDSRTGMMRTIYTYYFNDIICFKIGLNGGFDWLKKVRKEQVSVDDQGYYSSYARFIDNGKLCFIFNDHAKNYDENGKYNNNDYGASFKKNRNAVAIVKVYLETGAIKREVFFDRRDIGAIFVPRKFAIDHARREMILYAISGKREKYGLLKFKE
jgi:hypothetical protein